MTVAGSGKPTPRGRLGLVLAVLGLSAALALLASAPRGVRPPTLSFTRIAQGLGCCRGAGGPAGWPRPFGWVGGGGGGSEEAAFPAGPAACELDVQQGPIAEACHLVPDVCVDQQMGVLYGGQLQPQPGSAQDVPPLVVLEPSHRQSHYAFFHRSTGARDYRHRLPPLHLRPASKDEPTPYLADPVFSSCTVPVVYYSHYLINPAHMFRDNAANLFGALRETSWGEHAKVVLMTAMGLSPPRFAAQVMEAVTPHMSVETWAEFSSRLPSQQAPGGGYQPAPLLPPPPGGPRASWEGGAQRCFRHMYVCTDNINTTESWPLHAFGQHLVRHHLARLPPQAQPLVRAQPAAALQRRLRLAAEQRREGGVGSTGSGSSGSGSSSEEPAVLNILFHKRGVDRLLLNADELLERCNAWSHTTAAGVPVRARCREVELTDLFAGIVAAQQADIFIGAHGANMANGWLMRPGSAVLELTMHQFEEGQAHNQYAKRNMLDDETQVQYWKLLLCDPRRHPPGSWGPSPMEEEGRAAGKVWHPLWPKFRNLAVRWEVLELALREIVETGGDMGEYRQRWEEGRWWWLSGANETVYAGPNLFTTCRKAREAGLVS